MPSRRSYEQAMTWLRSKAADRDSLDGINAQLVINILQDYQNQIAVKGATIGRLARSLELNESRSAEYTHTIME